MNWVWPAVLRNRFYYWFRNAGLMLALLWPAWFSNVSAAPRIEIDHQFWNFGMVTNLWSVSHVYWVSNSGDAPLVINNIASSCPACLHVSIDKTNLPPGTATAVHALLDLRLVSGPVSRAVLITCNDPRNPTPVLELDGEGVPLYRLNPIMPSLDLAEGPGAVTVAITPSFQLHAPLSRVECQNTNLQARISPGPDGGSVLNIRAGGGFPESNTTVTVVVRSVDTNDPSCSVDVFIRNAPSLELVPPQLEMLPQDEEQTRLFWVKQHGPAPMALLDAVLPQDKYHCEIDPDPDGRDYTIYITAWQQKSLAGQTNELVLRMMDASNHERDINVPIYVAKP